MPVERLGREPPLVLVDVARGRRAPELVPQLPQQPEQLVPGGEPPRNEPGCALGDVPGAEVLDHRLRVHRRLDIAGELAHRRRLAQPVGAGAQLGEDLLVRIPLADSGLELRELSRVDRGNRPEARLLGHANNGRAG